MLRHKRMLTVKKQTLNFKALGISQAFLSESFSTNTLGVLLA